VKVKVVRNGPMKFIFPILTLFGAFLFFSLWEYGLSSGDLGSRDEARCNFFNIRKEDDGDVYVKGSGYADNIKWREVSWHH